MTVALWGRALAAARDRVEKSIAFAKSITAAQIEGTEDKDISWTTARSGLCKAAPCPLHFCLPSLYFHTTTAYNILRHRGIEIGKRVVLGAF